MSGSLVLDVVLFVAAVLCPGVVLLHAAGVRERLFLVAGGATLGLFGVPLLSYVLAVVLRTHVSATLVLVTGLGLAAVSGYAAWRRHRAHWESA